MGADVIVNTDADNQYRGADVATLVQPILSGQADMVVGTRPIEDIKHFSPLKKPCSGSGATSCGACRAPTFRMPPAAFAPSTARPRSGRPSSPTSSYTIETLIQASEKNIAVAHDAGPHPTRSLRESRLFTSTGTYIRRSLATMFRVYMLYQPLRFFISLAAVFLVAGLGPVPALLRHLAPEPVPDGPRPVPDRGRRVHDHRRALPGARRAGGPHGDEPAASRRSS